VGASQQHVGSHVGSYVARADNRAISHPAQADKQRLERTIVVIQEISQLIDVGR
jgi:hypothetical protein